MDINTYSTMEQLVASEPAVATFVKLEKALAYLRKFHGGKWTFSTEQVDLFTARTFVHHIK